MDAPRTRLSRGASCYRDRSNSHLATRQAATLGRLPTNRRTSKAITRTSRASSLVKASAKQRLSRSWVRTPTCTMALASWLTQPKAADLISQTFSSRVGTGRIICSFHLMRKVHLRIFNSSRVANCTTCRTRTSRTSRRRRT